MEAPNKMTLFSYNVKENSIEPFQNIDTDGYWTSSTYYNIEIMKRLIEHGLLTLI